MIRVVLDANQYVSVVLKPRSNPGRILELAEQGRIALFLSASILQEVRRVLFYPKLKKLHGRSASEIDGFLEKLERIAITTPDQLKINAIPADPSDNIYLACAVEAQADYIVSGDHHLKDLKEFQGIPILDPAAFLDLFK